MSISGQIQWWTAQGDLVDFARARGLSPRRGLYLTAHVAHRLSSPEAGLDRGLAASLMAAFENFVISGRVTVSMSKKPDAMLRRLTSARKRKQNKVWALRVKEPTPGARVLGLFAKQDCLICTEVVGRDVIDFDADMRQAEADWTRLFPHYKPVVSENIHDYLSSDFRNI